MTENQISTMIGVIAVILIAALSYSLTGLALWWAVGMIVAAVALASYWNWRVHRESISEHVFDQGDLQ